MLTAGAMAVATGPPRTLFLPGPLEAFSPGGSSWATARPAKAPIPRSAGAGSRTRCRRGSPR